MFKVLAVVAILGVVVANTQLVTPSTTSSSSTSTTSSSTVSGATATTPTTTVNATVSATTPSVTATVTPTTASVKPSTTASTPKTTKKAAPSALKSLNYLPGVCRNPSPKESAKCTAACKKQGLKTGACVKLVPPPRVVSLRSFICFCF